MPSVSRHRSLALCSVIVFQAVLASCGTDETAGAIATVTSPPDDRGLRFDTLNDKELVASYESKLGTAKLGAVVESDTKLSALADVNGTLVEIYATSDDGGHVGFRVHGGVLDEAAHGLLDEVHGLLVQQYPYPGEGDEHDATPPHVQLLRSYVGFLSEAPMRMRDELYDTRLDAVDRREIRQKADPPREPPPPAPPPCSDVADNDGVTLLTSCCNGGAPVPWQHDNLPDGHCFTTMVNWCGNLSPTTGDALATSCPGRCGPGCANFPGYYQDCLDHDLCAMHDAPSSLAVTPDGGCGDEWQDAVDDFAISYSWWAPMLWWTATRGGSCS